MSPLLRKVFWVLAKLSASLAVCVFSRFCHCAVSPVDQKFVKTKENTDTSLFQTVFTRSSLWGGHVSLAPTESWVVLCQILNNMLLPFCSYIASLQREDCVKTLCALSFWRTNIALHHLHMCPWSCAVECERCEQGHQKPTRCFESWSETRLIVNR